MKGAVSHLVNIVLKCQLLRCRLQHCGVSHQLAIVNLLDLNVLVRIASESVDAVSLSELL